MTKFRIAAVCTALGIAAGVLPMSGEAAVGKTAGALGVTPTGAATYSIPISLPPGPRGLQPSLALVYNSDSGDGTLGPGWSLAGFSAIYRCPQTMAQDGTAAAVALTTADKFCIDGNRLRMTGGAIYGADGSTYQTEIANFSNITAHGTTGNGPTYFTVLGKDGLTYEYGNTADSRITPTYPATTVVTPYQWLLNKVTDRSGNKYVIAYGSGAAGNVGTAVPLSVSYTPSSSGASTYNDTVTFTYVARYDLNSAAKVLLLSAWIAGNATNSRNILTKVTVAHSGTVSHVYNLNYQTAPTTVRARLSSIQECADAASTDCLPATTFGYQDGAAGVSNTATTVLSTGVGVIATKDINGDGLPDLVYKSSGVIYVAFSTGSGFGTPVTTGLTVGANDNVVVGDLVKYGHADIMAIQSGYWRRVYWNAGTGAFVNVAVNLAADTTTATLPNRLAALADINGDGLPDLVSMLVMDGGGGAVYTRLNTSAGGAASFSTTRTTAYSWPDCGRATGYYCYYWWLSGDGGGRSNVQHLDFNGDGREDVALGYDLWYYWDGWYLLGPSYGVASGNGTTVSCCSWLGSNYSYHAPAVVGYSNLNSDKCTDLVLVGKMRTSSCNGFAATETTFTGTAVATLDWDGDGLSDVLIDNSGSIGVYYSTGTGLAPLVATAIPSGSASAAADLNGDGVTDLLYSGSSSLTYRAHNVVSATQLDADLLTAVTDGYAATTSIAYKYAYQTSYPKKVVQSLTAPDGAGATYTKTFAFLGAAYDGSGRGFLGYSSEIIQDSRPVAPIRKSYFRTDFPYVGMVYQDDVYQANGTTLISHTTNTPSVKNLNTTAYNQRYFPYVSASATDKYEVGGSKNGQLIASSSASYTYDDYGNVTGSTTTLTDKDGTAPVSPTYNQSWTTTVTNTISTTGASLTNWCLGLPTQTTVAKSATGASAITRTTTFTPDYVKCRITQSVVEPASATYMVTTAYTFDDDAGNSAPDFGNVTAIAVTGINMTARATNIAWDTTGQFPVSTTDPEGLVTQATYDYALGLQKSSTDANNLTTSWDYDTFGRRTKTTQPNGSSVSYTYNDCASVAGGCQNGDPGSSATGLNKMVVIATHKDNAGVAMRDQGEWTYLDQLGRTIVTKTKTISGTFSRVGVQYDVYGRLYRQTAPCDAASCTVYWTTNTYDALGRLTQQQRPTSAANSTLLTSSISYQGMTVVATDPQSKTSTRITDPNGWMRQTKDHDGYYQSFTYDAFGSLTAVDDQLGHPLFRSTYDYGISAFARRVNDVDLGQVNVNNLNAGAWNYTVNALGEVTTYSDANGATFTLTYDKLSRTLTQSVAGEATRRWIWGTNAATHERGKLVKMCLDTNVDCSTATEKETYAYDVQGRLSTRTIVEDATYVYDYAYSATTGLLDTLTYPTSTSGYRLKLKYNYANGMPLNISDANSAIVFWQINGVNPRGQITQETLGSGVVTNRAFDAVTGYLATIQSGVGGGTGAQNESYLFDAVGNLTQRQNNALGLTESFYYDNLYRLDYSKLNGVTNLDMTYDAMGRVTNRTDVASNATWTYHATKLHAVTQAGSSAFTYAYDSNGNVTARNGQTVTWSKYNNPTTINGSASESATFSYDAGSHRWKQVYVNSGSTETTYYVGGLLEKVVNGSGTDYRHYIYAPGSTAAVAIVSRTSGGAIVTRYVLEDHQQSPSTIRDSSGALLVNESFTAYGSRRNPATWSGAPSGGDLTTIAGISRRGYTWQEAIGGMSLNHMNGRVQDPVTGRMLSADPYVSDAGNTQNYDRYAYVYNNPLSYTDPSGFDTVAGYDNCGSFWWSARCAWQQGYTFSVGYGSGIAGGNRIEQAGMAGGLDMGLYAYVWNKDKKRYEYQNIGGYTTPDGTMGLTLWKKGEFAVCVNNPTCENWVPYEYYFSTARALGDSSDAGNATAPGGGGGQSLWDSAKNWLCSGWAFAPSFTLQGDVGFGPLGYEGSVTFTFTSHFQFIFNAQRGMTYGANLGAVGSAGGSGGVIFHDPSPGWQPSTSTVINLIGAWGPGGGGSFSADESGMSGSYSGPKFRTGIDRSYGAAIMLGGGQLKGVQYATSSMCSAAKH